MMVATFITIRRVTWVLLVLAIYLIFRYGGSRDTFPSDVEEPEVTSATNTSPENAEMETQLRLPVEHLLSRPAEQSLTPPAVPPPVEQPQTSSPPVSPRIFFPYIQPSAMISIRSPALDVIPPTRPMSDESGESASSLFARDYVRKEAMLSRTPANFNDAWVAYSRKPPAPVIEPEVVAKELVDTAVPDDPDRLARAMFSIREAEALMSAGLIEQASVAYTEALAVFPQMTYAHKQLGRLNLMRGHYDEAIRYLAAALNADDDLPQTMNDLGVAYLYSGKTDDALRMFSAALEADPDYTEALFNQGLAMRRLNRLEEAGELFKQHIEQAGDNARSQRELAVLALMEERPDEALQRLDHAITLDQTWYPPHLDAALIHAEKNNTTAALRHLDLALELAPAWVVVQVYKQPLFREIRLIPESRAFEARLAAKARRAM